MASSIANSSLGGPSLDLGTLGSPAHYGSTLGPLNRSLGLGLSLLSPVTEGQNSRVEDYLAKVRAVINRQSVMVIMREFMSTVLFTFGHFHFHSFMVFSVIIRNRLVFCFVVVVHLNSSKYSWTFF